MNDYAFIELENVISNTDHRSQYRRDYDTYAGLASDDEPNLKVLNLIEVVNQYMNVVVFSVSKESNRLVLEEWLRDTGVECEELLLRTDGDYTPDHELRIQMIADYFNGDIEKGVERTAFCMLNNERAIEGLRELGYFVLQSNWDS